MHLNYLKNYYVPHLFCVYSIILYRLESFVMQVIIALVVYWSSRIVLVTIGTLLSIIVRGYLQLSEITQLQTGNM
jgi:hypothetical protein